VLRRGSGPAYGGALSTGRCPGLPPAVSASRSFFDQRRIGACRLAYLLIGPGHTTLTRSLADVGLIGPAVMLATVMDVESIALASNASPQQGMLPVLLQQGQTRNPKRWSRAGRSRQRAKLSHLIARRDLIQALLPPSTNRLSIHILGGCNRKQIAAFAV
jgi:hypothetical protein